MASIEQAPRHQSRAIIISAALGLLWFQLWRFLSNEWAASEQYSYGWFVPFFAIYLFWARWDERHTISGVALVSESAGAATTSFRERGITGSAAVLAFTVLLATLLPIRFFEIAAPDWRPIGWIHATVVTVFTLLALRQCFGSAAARHFAFPVLFVFVAVPWLPAIETPLIQGLMRSVAATAAELATWFGVPTQVSGNVIQVSTGLVGINEACSGVRSLQTSIMIGLLFGELKRLDLPRRALLVGAAVIIALIANVGRALLLVVIAAARGIEASERWHDFAGYLITAIVFFATLIVVRVVRTRDVAQRQAEKSAPDSTVGRSFSRSLLPIFAGALGWMLAVEAVAELWYRSHERGSAAPRWTVQWPTNAPNFKKLPIEDSIRSVLRYDEGDSATWTFVAPGDTTNNLARTGIGESQQPRIICVSYLFRWDAGRSSILRARAHRPDICLPSAGWQQQSDRGIRLLGGSGITLPFRHFEFARTTGDGKRRQFANAFFCISDNDARVSSTINTSKDTLTELHGLQLVPYIWRLVQQGERPHAQQVMQVLFFSTQELPAAIAETTFGRLVPELVVAKPPAP